MRLQDVARRFDMLTCVDAYTGRTAFKAQLGLYDDTRRDSETAGRRVLSVGPEAVIPARRVVAAAGTYFILGHSNPDSHRGSVIRIGYVAHEATHLASIRTLAQACAGITGVSAWASRSWVKNNAYTEQGSELAPQFHAFFAAGEPLAEGQILGFGTELYLSRSLNLGTGGAQVVLCERIAGTPIETVSIQGTGFDTLTSQPTGTVSNVRVVRLRWQSLYHYANKAAPTFGPEDCQMAFSKDAVTAKPGMLVTASDGRWKLASVDDEAGVWLCRAVRHGA